MVVVEVAEVVAWGPWNMPETSDLLRGCTRPTPRPSRRRAALLARSLWLILSWVGGDSEVGGLSL